jgi:hypothetical protein
MTMQPTLEYIISTDDLENHFEKYVSLNNICFSKNNSLLDFLLFEYEQSFNYSQKQFCDSQSSLDKKYYFIAIIGSIIKLHFGIIITIIMRKNFSAYYPLF